MSKYVTAKEVESCRPFLVLPEGPQSFLMRVDSLIRLLDTVEAAMDAINTGSHANDCICAACELYRHYHTAKSP